MNIKNNIWKYATAGVVVLIALNPELAELALFIDAVGLEIFLLLFEIQLFAIISLVFNSWIKPISKTIKSSGTKYIPLFSCTYVNKPECLLLIVPGPTLLMHMLVFSALLGIAITSL